MSLKLDSAKMFFFRGVNVALLKSQEERIQAKARARLKAWLDVLEAVRYFTYVRQSRGS
jgi:hypothetical protein